jgi:cysteine synthase
MIRPGLETHVVDRQAYDRAVDRFAAARVVLPTFEELAHPDRLSPAIAQRLAGVDPDAPDASNLFRVHWLNADDRRGSVRVPAHVVLPRALTGVDAPIAVLLGDRFPMIHAHKVLAAYACLAPRVITGQFDPSSHKAVWPSTGNYCRGGVAISRILGCRGVAVLPEGMSAERFAWLERWVTDPSDIIRTPGTESNVKEIYDRCHELSRDPAVVVFNQFSEFGNYLAHYACTGRAAEVVMDHLCGQTSSLRLAAFVSATGSAGTLGAGDYLEANRGSRVVAVEAVECPTLLYNGFGEHNIQGIGDKHVPFIHNVMNTDFVIGVSDRATDRLMVLFNSDVGRTHLQTRRHVSDAVIAALGSFGVSGICNVLASIKLAKYAGYGPDDLIVTVATDGAALYRSEQEKAVRRFFGGQFDEVSAAEVFGEHLLGAATDHVLELSHRDRTRIFNLGYYTWVEQQGVPIAEFEARRQPAFWKQLPGLLSAWDAMIREFNARVSTSPSRT